MTEERLKEIKDSIDFQLMIGTIKGHTLDVIKEEEELYNEVVRLKEILEQNNLTLEQLTGVENA